VLESYPMNTLDAPLPKIYKRKWKCNSSYGGLVCIKAKISASIAPSSSLSLTEREVNCSVSGWKEHGEIMFMWRSVDSMWGDIGITWQLTCRSDYT
jgi:hypothetical protein